MSSFYRSNQLINLAHCHRQSGGDEKNQIKIKVSVGELGATKNLNINADELDAIAEIIRDSDQTVESLSKGYSQNERYRFKRGTEN